MMTWGAALFDLDGVVFDTEPQYSVFWGMQMRRYFPDKEGLENAIKGQTLTQIMDAYFANDPQAQKDIVKQLDDFERGMDFRYVDGFCDFIQDLRGHGVKTALVTSSNDMKMASVYRSRPEVRGFFDEILTAESFTESKPSPECYLKGAALLGFAPAECVGFEDSFNGLKSVRAAGMHVVGLSTTNPEEAIRPYSECVIPDYLSVDYDMLVKTFYPEC